MSNMSNTNKLADLKFQIYNHLVIPLYYKMTNDSGKFADKLPDDSLCFFESKLTEIQDFICQLNEIKENGEATFIAECEDFIFIMKHIEQTVDKFLRGNINQRREATLFINQIVHIIGYKWLNMRN